MTVRRAFVASLLVAAVVLAACSDDDDAAPATDAPTTAAATVPPATDPLATDPPSIDPQATDVPATDPAVNAEWERVVPEGDCNCSDGSEFNVFVLEADPSKVVFFLQGGGACWNATTCAVEGGTYKVTTGDFDNPQGGSGIFDLTDPRNPFAGYSMVYVPYCTGDVHIGDALIDHAPDLTVDHNGANNGKAAIQVMAERFPDATKVVVAGESAGSIPSPLYAGLIADELPGAGITVLADGSGAYSDDPSLNALTTVWNTAANVPDWPTTAGLAPDEWSVSDMIIEAGQHAPDIVFARHDYAYDGVQTFFAGLIGMPVDSLLGMIDANEVRIEDAGVNLFSYISPGDGHTVLSQAAFYTEEVNGVLLHEWVTQVVQGDDVDDVHCDACE